MRFAFVRLVGWQSWHTSWRRRLITQERVQKDLQEGLENFVNSPTTIAMTIAGVLCGTYIFYKDCTRYNSMLKVYITGNILPPLADNSFEMTYFPRPDVEQSLRSKFNTEFSNMYFLVNGEVGTGKTRTIIELVRNMMDTDGAEQRGAPIYVLATQGKSFPESLANAVNFNFDEHISYKFLMDFLLRIDSVPEKDDDSRLIRVLDAIEKSSFIYMQRTGRPVVLIIDGINSLPAQMPGALEKIQDKAKLWADTNTVKVIFINNDEDTEEILQDNSSSWSRSATPMNITDLSRDDAIQFLLMPKFIKATRDDAAERAMSREIAEEIVDLVGGRVIHLISFKRDFVYGIPINDTAERLKEREKEKFIHANREPSYWTVIGAIRTAPDKCIRLSKLVRLSSQEDVSSLARHDILRYDRERVGVLVRFQSPLTESVVDELQQLYETGAGLEVQDDGETNSWGTFLNIERIANATWNTGKKFVFK